LGSELIIDPYLADILAQPGALRKALKKHLPSQLNMIHERLQRGNFDRILLSGMGSSYYASYLALIQLASQRVPVQLVNASELLHSLRGMIGTRSLLWLNSQSGRSAELVHLLEQISSQPPACILTFSNDLTSPMAEHADVCLPIHAGVEATISTKTYVNMLAINLLAAIQLLNSDLDSAVLEMYAAADAMEMYLANWEVRLQELDSLLGNFGQLFLIGRGSSMSAVWNGSLINY
jgi:glutamine---fructose-6-phosphate transaminase (isomerizing)